MKPGRPHPVLTGAILVALFLVSFQMRWQYIQETRFIQPVRADALEYTQIAYNLAYRGLFTISQNPTHSTREARPPGYCFFLAAIAKLTDSPRSFHRTARIAQCVMGALTVLLTFALASFLLPVRWAFLPALLVLLSPHMIAMSAFLLTESLFTVSLTASLAALCYAFKAQRLAPFLAAGVVLGIAVFVRPALALFPGLVVVLGILTREGRTTRALAPLIAFALIASSLLLGWTVWKRDLPPTNNLFADTLMNTFLIGMYPQMTYEDPERRGRPQTENSNFVPLLEGGYGEILRFGLSELRDDPAGYVAWWLVGKPVMLWSWDVVAADGINVYPVRYSWFDRSTSMGTVRTVMVLLQPLFVILAIASIVFFAPSVRALSASERVPYLLVSLLLAHFTLIFMVLAPFPRYALPLGPGLFTLFSYTLWQLWSVVSPLRVKA